MGGGQKLSAVANRKCEAIPFDRKVVGSNPAAVALITWDRLNRKVRLTVKSDLTRRQIHLKKSFIYKYETSKLTLFVKPRVFTYAMSILENYGQSALHANWKVFYL